MFTHYIIKSWSALPPEAVKVQIQLFKWTLNDSICHNPEYLEMGVYVKAMRGSFSARPIPCTPLRASAAGWGQDS